MSSIEFLVCFWGCFILASIGQLGHRLQAGLAVMSLVFVIGYALSKFAEWSQ